MARLSAYHDFIPSFINGEQHNFHSFRGCQIQAHLSSALKMMDFNTISVRKRKIPKSKTDEQKGVYSAPVSLDVGSSNQIKLFLWSDIKQDYSASLVAGDKNILEAVTHSISPISIGNNNYIYGTLENLPSGPDILNNNILINFNGKLKSNTSIVGRSLLGPLMFETTIATASKKGDVSILVADAHKVMAGQIVYFGTKRAGFARRKVTGATLTEIFFKEPLSAKEISGEHSFVFNERPVFKPAFSTTTAESSRKNTKKLILSDYGELHLRDVEVLAEEPFNTTVYFMRDTDKLAIVEDLITEPLPKGTKVVARTEDPFEAWAITNDETDTNVVKCDTFCSACIGRVGYSGRDAYTIVGFSGEYVILDKEVLANQTVTFPSLSADFYGNEASSRTTAEVNTNSTVLFCRDSDKFFVGQIIEIENIAGRFRVELIRSDALLLDRPLLPETLDGAIYFGTLDVSWGSNRTQSDLDAINLNLEEFVFQGENE